MMKIFLPILLMGAVALQAQTQKISVIPQPVEVKAGEGFYRPGAGSSVTVSSGDAELGRLAGELSGRLKKVTGLPMSLRPQAVSAGGKGDIHLQLNKEPDASLGEEGYRLSVGTGGITITANRTAGIFYGMQTLYQLLPPEVDGNKTAAGADVQVPAVEMMDKPRYAWRGLMFDVSRHFFTKEEVMGFIDEMVRYKYNIFHWHLTDDEGWRIEIKSYPNLTKKGAWNVRKTGNFGNFTPPGPDEKRDYGGFYTQEDIREVVRYAKERYVNILPEIDVPGHSLAAIVSYPELSCTPGADKYVVRSGEKIMNWGAGGFTALVDNTLCPANEKVYVFLDKVFSEVASLFPFQYIHMGGDEAAKNFWEKSPQVKELMKKEGLKDMHQVQSYFVRRVSGIIGSKGRKLIGWDEILEGGLAANAAVMSWRGIKGGLEAAKMGHEVVMTPNNFVYLDFMQGDRMIEPPVYSTLRLKKTYTFDPVSDGIDPKMVKGGQGNLWTEQVYNTRHMQYMLWPRALALAECLWSPAASREWNGFTRRVEDQFVRMDMRNVKYSTAMFEPVFNLKKDARDSLLVELSTDAEGMDIHYSFDYSHPDRFYPKYTGPLEIPADAQLLRVVTYRNGKQMGRQIDMPVAELRKRAAALKK